MTEREKNQPNNVALEKLYLVLYLYTEKEKIVFLVKMFYVKNDIR